MPKLEYGNTTIEYILYKQQRKDLKITVTLVNGVEVYAPFTAEDAKISTELKKKAPWIINKLNELNQVEASIQPKEFVSGEKLPYLGRNYRLKIHREPVDRPTLTFYQGQIHRNRPEKKDAKTNGGST
ncbi:YgjP-like metallopeptidase domain-containing protein [Lentibacillus sp. CBA3610]|uniref:YgjP-like metallopeptidase domain-containing protein n=1 Tax=Lentibacillus sp. CBA3610 TaxID=2518176 RepID=UPI0020D223C8|nr:YgjP-like metallopeptidase domain-containing protein [Lentibacillus sp. CBA3610]